MDSLPAFFKVFIAEISETDLKIPPAFTRSLEEPLPKRVYLRDKYKNVWAVKVTKVGDCYHFVDGWAKFALDNLLASGDILVFEYYSDSWLVVIIFRPSATEKNVLGQITLKIDHTVEKQDQVSKDDDDDDYDYDDGDGGGDEEEETEDGNDVQTRHQVIEQEESVRQEANTGGAGTSRSKRQRIYSGDCYGSDIFRTGRAQQPANPYFVTKVMQKRKSTLFIPREVIEDFKLFELPQKITLVDPIGREFAANCKKWKDKRVIISGGWRSLCRVNLVMEDDICICEFLELGSDGRQFLSVSFV